MLRHESFVIQEESMKNNETATRQPPHFGVTSEKMAHSRFCLIKLKEMAIHFANGD